MVEQWKGVYRSGSAVIKINFSSKNEEVLITYFPATEEEPPDLIREALKTHNQVHFE